MPFTREAIKAMVQKLQKLIAAAQGTKMCLEQLVQLVTNSEGSHALSAFVAVHLSTELAISL